MKTRRFCPKCGRMLLRSRIEGYAFQCMNCDEDFYRFEVLTGKQKRIMERDKNYDLELAKYIWSILKSNLPILMSWGVEIETVKVIKCGIEFKVNGFKHTGKVQIVLNEGADLFEVYLIGEDGEIRDKREDIYFDMLVSVVDELVEKTDDYEKRISETYNIIKY